MIINNERKCKIHHWYSLMRFPGNHDSVYNCILYFPHESACNLLQRLSGRSQGPKMAACFKIASSRHWRLLANHTFQTMRLPDFIHWSPEEWQFWGILGWVNMNMRFFFCGRRMLKRSCFYVKLKNRAFFAKIQSWAKYCGKNFEIRVGFLEVSSSTIKTLILGTC